MKIRLPIRKPRQPQNRPTKLKLKASVARARRPAIVEEEDFLEEPEPNMRLSHAFVVVLVLHVIAVAGVFAFNSIKTRQSENIFSAAEKASANTATAASVTPPAPAGAQAKMEPAAHAPAPIAAQPAPVKNVTPAKTQGTEKTHELQPGETLTKVSSEYGVTVEELAKANHITDPTKIPAGTLLTIPGADASAKSAPIQPAAITPVAAKASEPAKPAAPKIEDSGKIYVVVKGDNPVTIAKKLKVSYESLLSLNKITDPRKLQIGQKLKIPASAN